MLTAITNSFIKLHEQDKKKFKNLVSTAKGDFIMNEYALIPLIDFKMIIKKITGLTPDEQKDYEFFLKEVIDPQTQNY